MTNELRRCPTCGRTCGDYLLPTVDVCNPEVCDDAFHDLADRAPEAFALLRDVEYEDAHGCFSGDCPHDNTNQCVDSLHESAKENAARARALIEGTPAEGGSAVLTEMVRLRCTECRNETDAPRGLLSKPCDRFGHANRGCPGVMELVPAPAASEAGAPFIEAARIRYLSDARFHRFVTAVEVLARDGDRRGLCELLHNFVPSAPPSARDELGAECERESGGRLVREAWVRYCYSIGDTKPSHVAPWEELSEADKEADRVIYEAVARALLARIREGGKAGT